MSYINIDSELFTKGPYKNENVFEVGEENPEYIQRILDKYDLEYSERILLNKAIGVEIEERNWI